jgi:uncharacterized Rmd1/YagE family protein
MPLAEEAVLVRNETGSDFNGARLHAAPSRPAPLTERDQGLDRKLELISRTAVTLQGLLQNRSFLRLEWYVIFLIVTEIVISIYSTLFR